MSRRRGLGLLAIVAAVAAIAVLATGALKPNRDRLVVIGHSYVARDGWVDTAADRLDLEADRYAMGGAESSNAVLLADGYTPASSDRVVIEVMLNDARRFGTERAGLTSYRQSLDLILRRVTSGSRPRFVGVLLDQPIPAWAKYPPYDHGSDAALAAYSRVARSVARKYRATIIDSSNGWNPAAMIDTDGVHPNANGNSHIAAAVERFVR